MGLLNLRSLLFAAIILSNCITWTASRHHYTHNVNGHRSRHRRQGAGLYLSASYVIPGGEGTGAWGEWGEVTPCSRTCGGGVASQKRICLNVAPDGQRLCTGGDTKYFSCQTQDCPAGSRDFRSEQCSEFDNVSFKGIQYKWVPYLNGPNPCELNCMPHGERFYYRQKAMVTDGTLCNEESLDVCVNGTCQPVGCDRMLGSSAREDKCLNCRGNGENCHTVSDILDTQDLRKGYNDMLLIPQGATSIVITEVKDSSNYLALRGKNGTYYLNGDYHIDFPKSLTIAGAHWYYERNQRGFAAPDKLRSQGPTDQPLILVLLLQDENVGIKYEYSIPSSMAPQTDQQYNWVHDDFTPCSATCGGGFQTRNVTCRSREELDVVADNLCEEAIKPPTNQTCGTDACPAQWVEGPWSECSRHCGEGGTRSRQVHCEKIITNGFPSIVADKECIELLGEKPKLHEECNKNASCPIWFTGPWKPCDKLCGEGKKTRQVVCYQKSDGKVQVLDDKQCEDEKPPTEEPCMLHPCEGVDWVLSDWAGCDSCLSTVRTRVAECTTKEGTVVNATQCAYHPEPEVQQPCDRSKLPACEVQWYATQWSKCSAQCGKGMQTRKVFCGLFDGASVLKVDDSRCENQTKYNETKDCEIPKDKCPAKWYAGPWSECTKLCGGGEQHRSVMCLRENKQVNDCDIDSLLDNTQSCNIGPCNEDDVIPVDEKSTTIMDYYDEDCEEEVGESEEEEKYEEVGAEEVSSPDGSSTFEDLMFSDSPSTLEGSGWSSYVETGSGDFTTDGSGWTDLYTSSGTDLTSETEETLSTSSGSSGSDETTESGATDQSTLSEMSDETTVSGSTDETSESGPTSESGATDVTTESGSTETSESGGTDESTPSGATEETTESGATDETTESGSTNQSSESGSTDATSESGSTDETTESGSTEDTSETGSDMTSKSSSTDASSESSSTDETTVSGSDLTTESGATDETTVSGSDVTTESGATDETTVSGSTEETTEISSTSESGATDETTESGATTESGETTESGATTESGETTESGATTETGTEESTISGATDETTISGATDETTESGPTSETTVSGSTEESTTESGMTSSTEITSSTETEETSESESTTEFTGSTETTEYSTTEATGSTETEETESTLEGSSTTEMYTEESTTESGGSTIWDFATTVQAGSRKKVCNIRKSKCRTSKFGCCPDNRTPAAGPFDEGCPNPRTCKEAKFGCCPDGVSPAAGPKNQGCPIAPCNETLFGCCLSDNITASEGNDQEGCPPMPPPCKSSKFGCCEDGETEAKGPKKAGCPETEAKKKAEEEKKKAAEQKAKQKEAEKACKKAEFGCCYDNITLATGPDGEGCPCNISQFGCCPEGTPASGPNFEGCEPSCNTSTFGCCPDNKTPAHGYDFEGCCLLYPYGCCPDNYKPAEGPHLEGCGCESSRFGCCPDNVTIASGPSNEGCGCQYTPHGCCPDRHTPASGADYEGCGCHTYQFGCCDDGVTIAKGPGKVGCHCRESKYGCCGDERTPATGPNQAGCDCASSKYGCCPDGQTPAQGQKFLGCTDIPENRQASCSLPSDRGTCRNYSVYWYYDMEYGGCSRFWYGGCEGNGNRFISKEECEDVCVQPAPKDACKLPQVKGACVGYHLRWYYDSARERCSQFVFGGCLGNANNFDSEELCSHQCEPERSADQCELPLEPGSCAGSYPRWGYNKETGRCEAFTWGGCEGNNNRFSSEAACREQCDPPGKAKDICKQPQEAGNCTDKLATWSFSQTENRCVPFYYTGCGGNDNRFEFEQHCQQLCPATYVKDACELPAEIGECADYRQNWYYDTAHQRCQPFYYGGCGGNENNFPTEQQCQARCAEQQPTTTTTTVPATAPNNNTQELCFLEIDPGPCTNFETRWAYDTVRGTCTTFQYGGCGGNSNNFPAAEYCQYYCNTTQDICQLPMLSGPCDDSVMQWFYDPRSDSCSQFTYGGCEGNGNRFDTMEDCERRCRTGPAAPPAVTTTTTSTMAPTVEEVPPECQISQSAEECVEAGVVWYLDPRQRACVSYDNPAPEAGSGCRRSGTFHSEEACLRACGAFRGIEVCRYPMNPGPCHESVSKIYYDQSSDSCRVFEYGGCHGGPNRFSTVDECTETCKPQTGDVCSQPLEPGNCVDSFAMWYYEASSNECAEFVYSGCNGNDNRFSSREECENQCRRRPPAPETTTTVAPLPTPPPEPIDEECRVPESLAPCGQNITAFYYDAYSRSCIRSDVGGCRYPNTYQSEEECERRCGAFKDLDVCRYPLDVGPCKESIPKFYFEMPSGRCEPFAYGGCGGGPNRFSSIEECEQLCVPAGPDPACLEPLSSGWPCDAVASRRWYYSVENADCLAYIDTGCGTSRNSFYSLEQCTQLCKKTQIFDTNEVLPDCSQFEAECSSLRCSFGMQHTRTSDGCKRCSCVPEEVNCGPLLEECERLKCTYGVDRSRGADGCERCRCFDHPCASKACPPEQRCVASAYRDAITQDTRYSADCKTVNKTGACPPESPYGMTEGQCRRECNDDADCRGVGKCCARGCSYLCLEPASPTSPMPRTTTYTPEMPQAPQANSETEPEVTASEGDKATLRCLFHGNPPPKITWRRGEITIDGNVGRYRLLSDGALEIVSLYRNDSGVYICVAENIHGHTQQEIRLQVNDPVDMPAGISGEPNAVVTGEIGRSLILRCLAYGYPEPSVLWHRGVTGPLVPFSSALYEARGNSLLIRRLDTDTLGEYTCEAYNGIQRPASWSILVQAYSPEEHWQYPNLVTRENVVTVTQRPQTTETTSTIAPEITIPVFTVPVRTHINVESTTLVAGSELNLPCDVDGYPLPAVHWTKDGVRLSPNQRTQITEARLTISGVTVNDSGLYGCHASNEYSWHYDTVQINVQGMYIPAQCTDNPFFANCHLIVRSKYCQHKYYSKFCCKSCMEAGQLNTEYLELQADQSWEK